MNEYPIIRLELQRMKQSMLTHLGIYHQGISDQVERYMENAIQTFDFEMAVGSATHDAIEEVINEYFKWGEGRRVIKSAIEDSLNQMFKDRDES